MEIKQKTFVLLLIKHRTIFRTPGRSMTSLFSTFIDCVKKSCSSELNVNETDRSDDQANYLDMTFMLNDSFST